MQVKTENTRQTFVQHLSFVAVGVKDEQHSPSPEPERRKAKESTARFPRVYVASIGLEIAGKCKDPPTEFQQQLNEISEWEWSDFYRQVLKGKAENWNSEIPPYLPLHTHENPTQPGGSKARMALTASTVLYIRAWAWRSKSQDKELLAPMKVRL